METWHRARSEGPRTQTHEQIPSLRPLASSRDLDAELKVWADLLRQIVEFGSVVSQSERTAGVQAEPIERTGGAKSTARVAIFRLVGDGGSLRRVASSGSSASKLPSELMLDSPSLVARAAKRGEALYAADIRTTSDGQPSRFETRSEYALPLTAGSRVVGAVGIESGESDGIGPVARRLIGQTARKVVLALDRSQRLALLRESEARFHSIFERGNVCIGLLSPQATVRSVNPAFAGLLGSGQEEFSGHSLMDFVVAEDAGPLLDGLSQVREGTLGSSTTECRLLHTSGRIVWAMVTISLLSDAGAGAPDFLIVAHDIQERKRAEAERTRMQERLAQGQKMKALGALAGGVAHDFNNLLGVISGYISMLRSRLPREDSLQQVIATMQVSAGRACELTQQLLHFSRQEAPRLGHLNISKSLNNVLKIVTQTFDRRIKMQYRVDADLPTVMGDAGQLELALLNLCLNARDAMPDGGTLTLEASVVNLSTRELPLEAPGPAGDYVRIVVRDTGEGMDAEVISRIFEPFFTTKEDRKGAGLGLALVHGTVMHHQGFIGVRSLTGRGSEFTVHVPVALPPMIPTDAVVGERAYRSGP